VSLSYWLRDAAAKLAPISDTPRLDAELIAAHAAGLERGEMLLRLGDLAVPAGADALLARRLAHEPVAHITGTRDFWTLSLKVTPDVLIPRPDSETLIEAALRHFAGQAGPRRILDLGTGSGALLLAALSEWPQATGLGVDISAGALAVARENAGRCGLADRAEFVAGDWAQGLDGRFDLILCNPPYIEADAVLAPEVADHEPHGALFAGADGLDCYRRLAPEMARLLETGGIALFEIGHDQGRAVSGLFAAEGFAPVLHHDLGGRDRGVSIILF
jgi:release factor glutamine methyltransferase